MQSHIAISIWLVLVGSNYRDNTLYGSIILLLCNSPLGNDTKIISMGSIASDVTVIFCHFLLSKVKSNRFMSYVLRFYHEALLFWLICVSCISFTDALAAGQ